MSKDKREIQSYSIEEFMKMAQEKKKPQTNGRGVGIWLISWGIAFFAFERYCGLDSYLMWLCRGLGLVCLLFGMSCFGMSLEKVRKE